MSNPVQIARGEDGNVESKGLMISPLFYRLWSLVGFIK